MSKASNKKEKYPSYFLNGNVMYAFTAKDNMYKIEMVGSNSGNPGCTVDNYITRNMVLKLYGRGFEITSEKFKDLYEKLFFGLLDKIINS